MKQWPELYNTTSIILDHTRSLFYWLYMSGVAIRHLETDDATKWVSAKPFAPVSSNITVNHYISP